MGILKKANSPKKNMRVTFSEKNYIFIIPSRMELLTSGEYNKVQIGRFQLENPIDDISEKYEKVQIGRFHVEKLKETIIKKGRFTIS